MRNNDDFEIFLIMFAIITIICITLIAISLIDKDRKK